jgi:hypothetical protein
MRKSSTSEGFKVMAIAWRKPNYPPKPLNTGDWWKDSFGNTPRSSRRKFFAKVAV